MQSLESMYWEEVARQNDADFVTEEYNGYELYIHPTWTMDGWPICFIKMGGLSVHKIAAPNAEMAIELAKKWIDQKPVPLMPSGVS